MSPFYLGRRLILFVGHKKYPAVALDRAAILVFRDTTSLQAARQVNGVVRRTACGKLSMSMPGFGYRLVCNACGIRSPYYSLYAARACEPRSLPGWSRQARCFLHRGAVFRQGISLASSPTRARPGGIGRQFVVPAGRRGISGVEGRARHRRARAGLPILRGRNRSRGIRDGGGRVGRKLGEAKGSEPNRSLHLTGRAVSLLLRLVTVLWPVLRVNLNVRQERGRRVHGCSD